MTLWQLVMEDKWETRSLCFMCKYHVLNVSECWDWADVVGWRSLICLLFLTAHLISWFSFLVELTVCGVFFSHHILLGFSWQKGFYLFASPLLNSLCQDPIGRSWGFPGSWENRIKIWIPKEMQIKQKLKSLDLSPVLPFLSSHF